MGRGRLAAVSGFGFRVYAWAALCLFVCLSVCLWRWVLAGLFACSALIVRVFMVLGFA